MLKNQKGFTLIEIIAVLVILGILAAVAIPKYLDLQNEARKAAAQGFVAAAQSAISMGYAANILGNTTYTSPSYACSQVVLDAPSGVTNSLTCDATTWVSSAITATYGDQTATGTWTKP